MPESKSFCDKHELFIDRGTPCLYCVLESLTDLDVQTFDQILKGAEPCTLS